MNFGKAFVDWFGGFSRFLAAKFEAPKEKASGIFSVDDKIFQSNFDGKLTEKRRREKTERVKAETVKLALKKDTWSLCG